MFKYPRTPHLEGSRLQAGDDGSDQVRYSDLAGTHIVVEEKVDGANSGISFPGAELRLQSRGHFLDGGSRERQFSRFKSWAGAHADALFDAISDRYVVFGETTTAKHTVFYDKLPHLFLEFDVWDSQEERFLSTPARRELLADAPVVSVPVLYSGPAPKALKDLLSLLGPSTCRSGDWRTALAAAARSAEVDPELAAAQTDRSDLMEGLYIKIEKGGETVGRLKWVRRDFVQAITDSGGHWSARPMIRNGLAPGVDLDAPKISWETPGIYGIGADGRPKDAPAPAFPSAKAKSGGAR